MNKASLVKVVMLILLFIGFDVFGSTKVRVFDTELKIPSSYKLVTEAFSASTTIKFRAGFSFDGYSHPGTSQGILTIQKIEQVLSENKVENLEELGTVKTLNRDVSVYEVSAGTTHSVGDREVKVITLFDDEIVLTLIAEDTQWFEMFAQDITDPKFYKKKF